VRDQVRDQGRDEPTRAFTPSNSSQAVAAAEAGNGQLRILESRLNGMRILLVVNLVVLVVLLVWIVQLNRQLSQNRDELREMRAQAQTALGQLAPSLDARLAVFEKRMDAMDGKMKSAEDHLVNRMDTEIPVMLDKYINKKLAETKH
jgi:cell division protein FtsB